MAVYVLIPAQDRRLLRAIMACKMEWTRYTCCLLGTVPDLTPERLANANDITVAELMAEHGR